MINIAHIIICAIEDKVQKEFPQKEIYLFIGSHPYMEFLFDKDKETMRENIGDFYDLVFDIFNTFSEYFSGLDSWSCADSITNYFEKYYL